MHLIMILLALAIAATVRLGFKQSECKPQANWQVRWQKALFLFLFPPLFLFTTAIALLCMGVRGQMIGLPSSWISYAIAALFFVYTFFLILRSISQGITADQKITSFPTQLHFGQLIYVLELPNIFAAQIGFWQPKLVISQALLSQFDQLHLNAVLKHEEAHLFYRDTFWFFGFGCLRQITEWLPNTDLLWEELLLLRELRADRWAKNYVDALVLAESLLWAVGDMNQSTDLFPNSSSAALSRITNVSRLEERIEILLNQSEEPELISSRLPFEWLALTVLPLISVLLHS
jgi:Zn-dependent protease with chaperone function